MAADARFLRVFREHAKPGEWLTAAELAKRLNPPEPAWCAPPPRWLFAEWKRAVSRKLSNLNRFGHLDRRYGSGHEFEYALASPVAREARAEIEGQGR